MGPDPVPDRCSRAAHHAQRRGLICQECGFDPWRVPPEPSVPVDGQVDERKWEIEVCNACSWQVDDQDECGCEEDAPAEHVFVEVVPASERDRLAAAEDSALLLKDEAERCVMDLLAEKETLREALDKAWEEAHGNHRAIKRREVDCGMWPCPQIRAALAPASDETGETR